MPHAAESQQCPAPLERMTAVGTRPSHARDVKVTPFENVDGNERPGLSPLSRR